jgi:hypothetical protein
LQGRLGLRIAFYWVLWQVGFAISVFSSCRLEHFSQNLAGPEPVPWQIIRQGVAISALLLPVALIDMLVFSNRFAGPLLRLRRGLKQLARGDEVSPIHFRKRDLLQDLSGDFNLVLERMNAISADREVAHANEPVQRGVKVECPLVDSGTLTCEAVAESAN